jgi:carbamoyl-phosphate synthase small subunit
MSPRTAWLILEDGTAFRGRAVGAEGERFGEAVFNTALTGYQEVLTDPSYKGQIVCMTYPHIGNYGVNEEDAESGKPWLEGFIIRELSPIASNFRAQEALDAYLKRYGVVAIDGVDTRALTLKLRQQGSMKGGISTTAADPQAFLKRVRAAPNIVGVDLVKQVTCVKPYEWSVEGSAARQGPQVVVMDFGVKRNILRQLAAQGCRVTVVPATTPAQEILARHPEGVLLSNGPGDPAAVTYAVETIQDLMGQVPIMGICLGHQLLGLAFGAQTVKLKFGHHGGNHPVQDLTTRKVDITSQNHNFAVDLDTLPDQRAMATHVNLNDHTIEGMRHQELPIFGIQYHPEAAPGPHDAQHLFGRFFEAMQAHA